MSTLILDTERNDDLLFINEEQVLRYASPFALDELYPNNINITSNECHLSELSSEDDEDFEFKTIRPQAPPPSPQMKPMMDILFSSKLNASLEACLVNSNNLHDNSNQLAHHAQALDKLLRKTIKDGKHNGFKRNIKQRRLSCTHGRKNSINDELASWKTRAKNQKLEHIAKATEQSEKLKKALLDNHHMLEEEMISELREMGL